MKTLNGSVSMGLSIENKLEVIAGSVEWRQIESLGEKQGIEIGTVLI